MPFSAFQPHAPTRILLTAAEAYPALEQLFLSARQEIWASFLVFDLTTELRSTEGRRVGQTWFDLMVHTLRRGVAVHMVISDFDPIVRPDLHRNSWRSARMFWSAAEMAGPAAKLDMKVALHPSETGLLPRLAVWPLAMHKVHCLAKGLNAKEPALRANALRDMPLARKALTERADGTLRPRWAQLPRLYPGVHHQKLAVFDRARLYIGGLDLDERRYDTPDHKRPGSDTWHDVQLISEGPVVAEAQAHLESFLAVTAGQTPPPRQRRFLRTLSRQRRLQLPFFGPRPVLQEIATAHEALTARAERLIYVESQYFRDTDYAHYLAAAAIRNPRLTMILTLPAAPEEVAFEKARGLDDRYGEYLQARALRILQKGFGPRLFVGGAAQPRRTLEKGRAQMLGAPLVYIHAKVSIFDGRSAIVSSANMNGRSLRWDTEAGVFLNKAAEVADLHRRILGHWLPKDAGEAYFKLETAQQAWAQLALSNARKPAEQRRGFILPYDIRIAEKFGQMLPGIPEEMC
ncbi:phospholipase D family protein [Neogemmobacter tilapiae]|uniref:Phospholipase D n=1 Tax=Neogemmobacter tilapiae TaxID=875041 RepID=A0A918TPY6_9RHOB|nr:phospholipase D-like domain-containing protein [Gemmobacter tilapiae]GHC54682.1 hypothetical protein GCM10007315_17060 [Gemmobacter tilapiae]